MDAEVSQVIFCIFLYIICREPTRHAEKHRASKGRCCFNHIIGLPQKNGKCLVMKALDNNDISSAGIPAEQMLEISARLIEDEDIRRIAFEPIMIDKPKKDVLYGFPYDQRINKIEKGKDNPKY
jgi:hypothetical protein